MITVYGYKELCCKGKRIIIYFLFIADGKQKKEVVGLNCNREESESILRRSYLMIRNMKYFLGGFRVFNTRYL